MKENTVSAENKIPKIIHYCWFGGGEMPQRIKDCIESWRIVLPDYEIRCWDDRSFDMHSVKWVEQAYAAGKWAFVADYIRLYALHTVGGIYLDTDVRVIKSFDPFLKHRAFSGIEWAQHPFYSRSEMPWNNGINIESGIMGCEKGHPVFKAFMDFYENREFAVENMNNYVMPHVLHSVAKDFGFRRDTWWDHQVIEGDFQIYPYDYFPGQRTARWDMYVTHNTVAIHLHSGSWRPPRKERLHSPYTELRLHLKEFLKGMRDDVFLRRNCITVDGKKYKEVERERFI